MDFDGVLHPEPCTDGQLFCHLPKLENLLHEFPAVQIVISSTWRSNRTIDELRQFFSPDIAARLISCTPYWQHLPELVEVIGITYTRQVEIEGWLRAAGRPWENWVALDDRGYCFKPFLPNLIKCESKIGITDEVLEQLRKKFNQ